MQRKCNFCQFSLRFRECLLSVSFSGPSWAPVTLHFMEGPYKNMTVKATGITLSCIFCCRPYTTTSWNDQILSLPQKGNGKPINSTISVWTWARSPLFTSNLKSLFLSNWATWHNCQKKWKDAKSIFQEHFHGRRHCQIVMQARTTPETPGVVHHMHTMLCLPLNF